MTLVVEKDTVRAQLRGVTADIHQALHNAETFAAIAQGSLQRDGYVAVLTMLHRYHQGLSEICERGAKQLGQVRLAKAHCARIAALRADMEFLGAKPQNQDIPDKGDGAFAAGCLYTVQGSSLGGKVIHRQLDYLLPDDQGRSFFKGGAEDGRLLERALRRTGTTWAKPSTGKGSLVRIRAFSKTAPMKYFFGPAIALIALPALCLSSAAQTQFSQEQKIDCSAPLSPGSRAKIIAECSVLLKTPKLPAIVAGPAFLARGNAFATVAADFSKALDDFNSASDVLPKDPAPLNAAGIVLLKQRKLMEAFGAFDAANGLDGRDPTALYGRGLSRLAMGQGGQKDIDQAMGYDKNIAAFFKANDLYP